MIVRLGNPRDERAHYPIDQRRSKENVQAMREAEDHLDAFWAAVDRAFRSRAGDSLADSALVKLLAEPRVMQRTAEWVERQKIPRGKIGPVIETLNGHCPSCTLTWNSGRSGRSTGRRSRKALRQRKREGG